MTTRSFLSLVDLSAEAITAILGRASELKALHRAGQDYAPLEDRALVLACGEDDAQARFACEMAVLGLGARLPPGVLPLETLEQAAQWLPTVRSHVDALLAAGAPHRVLESLAKDAAVTVVSYSSDRFVPCRWLAVMQTFHESRGTVGGKRVAWIGSHETECRTFVQGTARLGYSLVIAAPEGGGPDDALLQAAGEGVTRVTEPREAAEGADLLVCGSPPGRELLEVAARNALAIWPAALIVPEADAETPSAAMSLDAAENQTHALKALLEHVLL